MLRLRASVLASVILLVGCLNGCRADELEGGPQPRSEPLTKTEVAAGTARDIRPVTTASYARTLEQQLALIPPDADAYLVIRDLRPLVAQARRVEQVMAGPLARAIPALAKIGGGSGEARLQQLTRTRELLALLLAGLEGSGVALDQGLVVAQGAGEPVVVFAAADLERLGGLLGLAGLDVDLSQSCGELTDQPGWFACSLGGAQGLAEYQPAKRGEPLAKALADRLGGVELDRVNVALSLAEVGGSIDAVLRTDPGLWELSMPVPLPAGPNLLAVGPAPALRALVPGTSFVWGRVDPSGLSGGAEAEPGPLDPKLLTGELWFGAVDDPHGFAAQAGITDASEVAKRIQLLAAMLPAEALQPEQLDGVAFELDRKSIELDGKLVPSVGLTMTGDAVAGWAEALGVSPRARIWAYGDYVGAAVGEVQAIPLALEQLEGSGPPAQAIANLPPTLAESLLAGEVGLIVHLVVDHWQEPLGEAELDSLLAGVAVERRPAAAEIAALFQSLAPWSSATLWLAKHDERWIANLSLVPFAAKLDGVEGVDDEELAAAQVVLDVVLTGGDGQAGYRELLARYPSSPRAFAYRARSGQAPDHHATVAALEVGLIGALVVPALDRYLDRAKTSEAERETQAILNAALAVHERTGSCASLLGSSGPTPPLAVQCHAADGGRCRPVTTPADVGTGAAATAGEYPRIAWIDDPRWSTLEYQPDRFGTGSHRFHYAFTAELEQGSCRLRVEASADLDGDGVFSSYVREATIAADGSRTLPPIAVEQGDE